MTRETTCPASARMVLVRFVGNQYAWRGARFGALPCAASVPGGSA